MLVTILKIAWWVFCVSCGVGWAYGCGSDMAETRLGKILWYVVAIAASVAIAAGAQVCAGG